jgi:hypothetical protein
MNTFNSAFLTSYRFFREQGETATRAAVMASREQRLRAAIADGSVRVRWVDDDDHDILSDDPTMRRRIAEGRYEVQGMIIERRKQCSECGHVEWEHVDSLWGIVLDTKPPESGYRRYLETEVYCG